MKRLSLATVPEAQGVDLPPYGRPAAAPFVHLGFGAFARAHLAVYADDLLRAGRAAGIRAVSLRHRRAEDELAPQDGLFTVTVREPSVPATLQLVGAVRSVTTGAAVAIGAIADPSTTFVTLTVTEKGYAPGGADAAPEVVAEGLRARRRDGGTGIVVASLDNLSDNGQVLRAQVLEAADRLEDGLPAWIERHVAFPCSVVDRMVPATTEADLADVRARLGLVDDAAVVAEAHRSWVIEAVDGLPPLQEVGVEVVADVGAQQQRKLWLLNGPHSALAYGGLLAGHDSIAAAAEDAVVAAFVRRLVDDVLEVMQPVDPGNASYTASSLRRFRNAALGHTCAQVGADGSQKLVQRVFPVVAARRAAGLDTSRPALVVAVWLAAVTGVPLAGRVLPTVVDPAGDALRAAMRAGGPPAAVDLALAAGPRTWAPEVLSALDRLVACGAGALEEGA